MVEGSLAEWGAWRKWIGLAERADGTSERLGAEALAGHERAT